MAFIIRQLQSTDRADWDNFVEAHPHGSPFHLVAWKESIENTFGFRSYHLLAREDDAIVAVLPLFLSQNLLTGKALISSPFAVYGGILATSEEARRQLYDHAVRLGESLQVDYLELRNAYPEQVTGESNVSRYVTFTQEVNSDEEALLQAIPKKTRNLIRKALKYNYSSRCTTDLSAFLDLYTKNLRRLGTPSFPASHFSTLMKNFGPLVDVREILLDGKVVAASMNFLFRGQMHTYYAASDQNALSFVPNNYLYFDHLRWAGKNGFTTFDFGRSKRDTGTFDFKRHWATTMRELPYELVLIRGKQLPNFSPTNSRFQPFIQLWQKLPLPVTRIIGPQVVRLFP